MVTDQATKEPLIGANVVVEKSSLGASTDVSVRFVVSNISVGPHSLTVRMVGYEPVTITDVLVTPERTAMQAIELRQSAVEAEEVVVTAGYFRTSDVASLGSVGFNAQEIRRPPGSANDVSRILMALPSVSRRTKTFSLLAEPTPAASK